MILGFYYHINVFGNASGLFLPDYLGLFIDELAKHTSELYYFAYTTHSQTDEQTYRLKENNIKLVDLGNKNSYPYTVVMGSLLINKFKLTAAKCDAILVRAPSPLAPYFYHNFKSVTRIHYLMVGDYMEGIKHQHFPFLKQKLINIFTYLNEVLQNKAVKNSGCIVNSIPLKIKYEKINKRVRIVKTTTLTEKDFYYRPDTCNDPQDIKLLFVGRIEKAKGLDELVAAFEKLRLNNYPVSLHLAGWDTSDAQQYFNSLSSNPIISDHWHYHGLLNGNSLRELYRTSDIFLLPSHHEGFPRVIWEAMANSIPVICTNVGSISYYLKDKHTTLIIKPNNHIEVCDATINLIENQWLRKKIILNSFKMVQDNTITKQTDKIVDFIKMSL